MSQIQRRQGLKTAAPPKRTYYRQVTVTWADWAMLASTILATVLVLLILARAGLLIGYGVVPED